MKQLRFITAILLLSALFLTSCGKAPAVADDFTVAFVAENTDSNLTYEGILSKSADSVSIAMTAPYAVKNTSFTYEEDDLRISLDGLRTEADSHYLPQDSMPSVLYRDISTLSHASYTGSDGKEDRYAIALPQGDAALTAVNGIPTSLSDPATGWEFTFSSAP